MDLIAPGAAIDLVFCRMPLKAIIELLLQIAGALEHAHNTEFRDEDGHLHRGIYHGDIKPANILVDNDRAYLTDFMLPNMQEFKKRDFGHPCFPFYETEWYGNGILDADLTEGLRSWSSIVDDRFSGIDRKIRRET